MTPAKRGGAGRSGPRRLRPAERQARQRRRQRLLLAASVMLVVGLGVALLWVSRDTGGDDRPADLAPPGTETFGPQSRNHVEGDVTYAQSPPVGGDHAPIWQNCGFYPEPVVEERAVHSLEHGAVWITFRPDLDRTDRDRLRDLAENRTFVLVSPREGLEQPVVASAWGLQLRLDDPDDPRLAQFVDAFAQGPQTPEPGAPCQGGVGTPP